MGYDIRRHVDVLVPQQQQREHRRPCDWERRRRGPAITGAVTSARGNFVAYSSTADQGRFDGNGDVQDVFVKHLGQGDRL